MAKARLTQLGVEKIAAPKSGNKEVFDTQQPAFGVRVFASGYKSFFVFYQFRGKQRRHTIGSTVQYKVDEARDMARHVIYDAAHGIDPKAAKVPALSVKDLVERFVTEHCKVKTRGWHTTERLLKRHVLPRWGKRPVNEIKRPDVRELLAEVQQVAPIGVNRVLAHVRRMFSWSVEQDLIEASPVLGVKSLAKETSRDRVLSDDELVRVWRAADVVGGAGGAFIKALILTGQRRNEVSHMRWADLDLEKRVWTLPREATKGDRSHEVPLSQAVLGIIESVPHLSDVYVFSRRDEQPISGFSKLKIRLEAEFDEPIVDWRLHDLRRKVATSLARLRVPNPTISRILNHKEGGVTPIYQRYSFLDEKRDALDKWATHLEALLSPKVVSIHAARKR